ncbi:MAG: acyltransferase [Acidobacteriota bacterium]|nr:acyltransferase [Acidobacteriota bacterium]
MSSGTWIPQIDGLRFMAICSVLLFHIFGQLQARSGHAIAIQPRYALVARLAGNGDRGVLLFFVISGYILARPFLRQHRMGAKPVSLGRYYLRRVTRLEPPYILSLLLYTAAFCAFGLGLRPMLPHLAASMFYVHNLVYNRMSTINFVTWSLEMEVQFYLLAPLLGMLYKLRSTVLRRGTLLALILAAGGYTLVAAHHPGRLWHWTILNTLQYFLTGFLLADLVEGHQTQPFRSRAWDAVSLLLWPTIFLLPRVDATLAWAPLVILPLYLAAFFGPVSNAFFRLPFVALTGGMCYSLYLMHMLVISIAFKATRHLEVFQDFLLNYVLQILSLGSAIVLCGTAYYVLIERPCMDPEWPGKLWARLRGRHAPGAAEG